MRISSAGRVLGSEIISKGFTLLELLVVLVIVGTMSALVVPKLVGSISNMELRSASKTISASLRYARSQATSCMVPVAALFDFDEQRVLIIEEGARPDQTGKDNQQGDQKEVVGKSKRYDLPVGVRFDKAVSGDSDNEVDRGVFEIVFSPNGSSSGGQVFLSNDRGKRYRISVDFVTGAVRLEGV